MAVPSRSRDLDSRRSAARSDSASDDAFDDARVSGARRTRGVSRGGGVLSSDEGRSKGEKGESVESEHGAECGVGVVCRGRMELDEGV